MNKTHRYNVHDWIYDVNTNEMMGEIVDIVGNRYVVEDIEDNYRHMLEFDMIDDNDNFVVHVTEKDKDKIFQSEIDCRFSKIQEFINENESLDEDSKENMISLCIECNDMIVCKSINRINFMVYISKPMVIQRHLYLVS